MKNIVCIIFTMFILCVCSVKENGSNNNVSVTENSEVETELKEKENENIQGDTIDYTNDIDIVDFMHKFASIDGSDKLDILNDLPLTKECYQKLVDDFDYFEESKLVMVESWALTADDTYVCLVKLYSDDELDAIGYPLEENIICAYSIKAMVLNSRIHTISINMI